MASRNVKLSQSRAFKTARELAKVTGTNRHESEDERRLKDRIKTLEYVVYGDASTLSGGGGQTRTRPHNRQRIERQKSLRLALEAAILALLILSFVGVLNYRFHFLW